MIKLQAFLPSLNVFPKNASLKTKAPARNVQIKRNDVLRKDVAPNTFCDWAQLVTSRSWSNKARFNAGTKPIHLSK